MLTTVLIVLHILVALGIIGLVLLQHGKGADMGSGFGGGASGSLFGATGSANFLSRATAVLAAVFFMLSLALAYTATRRPAEEGGGVIDVIRQNKESKVPAPSQNPAADVPNPPPQAAPAAPAQPSESNKDKQRRVGKECRSR